MNRREIRNRPPWITVLVRGHNLRAYDFDGSVRSAATRAVFPDLVAVSSREIAFDGEYRIWFRLCVQSRREPKQVAEELYAAFSQGNLASYGACERLKVVDQAWMDRAEAKGLILEVP